MLASDVKATLAGDSAQPGGHSAAGGPHNSWGAGAAVSHHRRPGRLTLCRVDGCGADVSREKTYYR